MAALSNMQLVVPNQVPHLHFFFQKVDDYSAKLQPFQFHDGWKVAVSGFDCLYSIDKVSDQTYL